MRHGRRLAIAYRRTREPDDGQIEVAFHALKAAISQDESYRDEWGVQEREVSVGA